MTQSKDTATLRLQLIEIFGLLCYKPKEINERIILALEDRKDIGNMNGPDLQKVMQLTIKYVTDVEYDLLLRRLTEGALKIEKMNPKSDEIRQAIKLYNRIERLVLELRRRGSEVAV